MNLKNTLIVAALAIGATSCSVGSDKTAGSNDSIPTDSVMTVESQAAEAKALEETFSKEVTEFLTVVYTKQSSEGVFSPEFEELKGSAEMTSFKKGDGMDYFDYDVLTQSQDPGALKSVEIVSVDGESVTAKVRGEGFGESGTIPVTVVRVDGKLYIDDVNGEKAKMKKYLGR